MNFRLVILFFIISLKGSSQEKKLSYHFDYYTVYEYKKDSLDSNPNKDIYYSNSKDNSYLFTIIMKKDTIFSAMLIDYSNQKMLIYKDELHKNNINDVRLFKSYISKEYNLDYCKNVKNSFYDINYKNIDNKKTIIINRYKNSKKKKLINQSFYETTLSQFINNQQYNFGVLATSLWCEKFTIKNEELITYSYFLEDKKKIYIRILLDIQRTDFNLNVFTTNNTTK